MEKEYESSTRLHLHAKTRIACAGWGENLRVLRVSRGKQLKGWCREAARDAGRFGGGLDAVTSTSSALLRGRRGGHGVVSLEEDAGLLPPQQQAISSPARAKIARENPFPSDAAPARERAVAEPGRLTSKSTRADPGRWLAAPGSPRVSQTPAMPCTTALRLRRAQLLLKGIAAGQSSSPAILSLHLPR